MAKPETVSQKPMLFGDLKFDARALEDVEKFEGENFDWSYVPGYSEQRRMNELRVRDGQKPIPMDKLYWPRVTRVDNSNVDYREATTVSRLGYRACSVDDLKERGWGMPPGAHVGADGLIRREDTALAIVDFDRAEKNLNKQKRENAAFEGNDITPEPTHRGITNVTGTLEKHRTGASLDDAANNLLA